MILFKIVSVHLMSEYEERELFNKLHGILSVEKDYKVVVPTKIRRLYRKLYVRNIKRNNYKKIFNLDELCNGPIQSSNKTKSQLLDRYYQVSNRKSWFQFNWVHFLMWNYIFSIHSDNCRFDKQRHIFPFSDNWDNSRWSFWITFHLETVASFHL